MNATRPGPEFIHEHNDFVEPPRRRPPRSVSFLGRTHDPHTDAVGTLYDIPDSDKGTEATLTKMAELAWKGRVDQFVIRVAMKIVQAAEIPRKQYVKEMESLFRFCQQTHPGISRNQQLRYYKDPYHAEKLSSPRRTIEFGGGDCDDLTVCLGSMLMALGHGPVRFVVVAADADRPDEFSHVYCWVRHSEGKAVDPEDGSHWIPLDPTVSKPFGWEVKEDVFRKAGWNVEVD